MENGGEVGEVVAVVVAIGAVDVLLAGCAEGGECQILWWEGKAEKGLLPPVVRVCWGRR